MGLLPIASNTNEPENHRCFVKSGHLPAFYMEDFSVMGLNVANMATAVAAL